MLGALTLGVAISAVVVVVFVSRGSLTLTAAANSVGVIDTRGDALSAGGQTAGRDRSWCRRGVGDDTANDLLLKIDPVTR